MNVPSYRSIDDDFQTLYDEILTIPRKTKAEQEALDRLHAKARHIRTAVRQVVKEYATGLFIWGEGGTGKSFNVDEELRALKARFILHNSRLTARGLVDRLQEFPDYIHFIEDAETLLEDKKTYGVLRSALWSQSKKKPPEREITWTRHKTSIRFTFTGGIIVVSNANLADTIPEIRAIKTRINVQKLDITPEEIQALMKEICHEGYRFGEAYMSPDECWAVAKHISQRLETMERPLDLRLLQNGFKDFLFHKAGESHGTHWKTLLDNRMAERVGAELYKGRAETKADHRQLAKQIYNDKSLTREEKIAKWRKETGLSEKTYYRDCQK